MSNEDDRLTIPIFPLPNLVFFPSTLLPLHIFETRYRQMVSDCLQGDRRIGMLLRRSRAELEDEPPPVFEVGTVGRIGEYEELEDGRYQILLAGQARFRLLRFLSCDRLYLKARVELIPEHQPPEQVIRGTAIRLASRFSQFVDASMGKKIDADDLLRMEFAAMVNNACHHLRMTPSHGQSLLEMDDLAKRGAAVVELLDQALDEWRHLKHFNHLRPTDVNLN